MSGPSSQNNPPPRPPGSAPATTVQLEGIPPGYIMRLPSISQPPRPLQVVQGLDGMIYALTTPATAGKVTADDLSGQGSVLPSKSNIGMTHLSQLSAGAAPVLPPQGLNFAAAPTTSAALLAAAAAQVQAGAQVNMGALAAAAAQLQQGQTPVASQFPFIPVYAPFSMSSSLLTQPPVASPQAISLQPVPLGAQVTPPAPPGARTFLVPATQSQHTEGGIRRPETTPSIQSLLAPHDVAVLSDHRRRNQSRSESSGSDCSPSPVVCRTETFSSVWSKNNVAGVSLNEDLRSPTLIASNYSGLDLAQRGAILQNQIRTLHEHPTTPKASEEPTRMDANPGSSSDLQNVKSLSSLSRYMNQPAQAAQMKHGTANISGGVSSLEKLLQAKPETKEAANTSSTSLYGTSVSSDQSMLALLQEEPHLSQFYDFFCKSHLSQHLRIRILTTEGGTNVLKWIEVTRQASHIDPSFGPIDAARIVISSNGLCKLQLMFPYSKTMSTRFVPTTMAQANELFSELSPKHVVCPGLPDCETKLNTLGYQPTNIRIVETPNMKRYDHEKCPVWHIPLPCNIYSESGQILHHMCKQCKNLLSTLNKTITKIAGLNVGASKNHELPYDLTMMMSSRPAGGSGLASPPYLLRPPPQGDTNTGQDGAAAKESHGRKRKRRAHPKSDDESSGSAAKSTTILPEIYQLLRDPATVALPQSAATSGSPSESTATTSTVATSSTDRLAVSASEQSSVVTAAPSSVIVQAKSHHHDHSGSQPIGDDFSAVQQPGGEYDSPDAKLVQADKPQVCESPSKIQCSDNPDIEMESSMSQSHIEDEREQGSTSPAEEAAAMDTSVIKKQKIS